MNYVSSITIVRLHSRMGGVTGMNGPKITELAKISRKERRRKEGPSCMIAKSSLGHVIIWYCTILLIGSQK